MSDTFDIGMELSPEENSYFESQGQSEIPSGEKAAEQEQAEASPSEQDAKVEQQAEQKMVSLAALHEERTRRKDLDRQLRDAQQKIAEFQGKFSIIDRLQKPQEQRQDELTPENDIFGYSKKIGETVQELQKRLDAQAAADKASSEQNSIVRAYQADAAQFKQSNPDFMDAYNHLLSARLSELQAIGYDDHQMLQQALQADEMAIAKTALERGKSPAEIIYNLAKQRGYQKADAKPAAAEKIETIKRGQAEHKSLSSAGGASGDTDMTAEALVKMPMDEFERWVEKNPAKARRLMGGA